MGGCCSLSRGSNEPQRNHADYYHPASAVPPTVDSNSTHLISEASTVSRNCSQNVQNLNVNNQQRQLITRNVDPATVALTHPNLTTRAAPKVTRDSLENTQELNQHKQSVQASIIRNIQDPQRSVPNPQLFNLTTSPNPVYTLIPLTQDDPEYLTVTRMITNKRNFKVSTIEKIENVYLQKAYELKKNQKKSQFSSVEEVLLFHGTKLANAEDICKNNFNWRCCQTYKFGRGVSFSKNSTYASVYSDRNVYYKIMFVAKVLIGRECDGNQFMTVPPEGFDTSLKAGDRVVTVKYEDNEFYPLYKITYHLVDENVGKKGGRRY